jgi:hypothetical protein
MCLLGLELALGIGSADLTPFSVEVSLQPLRLITVNKRATAARVKATEGAPDRAWP